MCLTGTNDVNGLLDSLIDFGILLSYKVRQGTTCLVW